MIHRGWPAALAAVFVLGSVWEGWQVGLTMALVLALPGAELRRGPLRAGLAAAAGLLSAALVQALVWTPMNLLLVPLCALIGTARLAPERWRTPLQGVALVALALAPPPYRHWAVGLGVALLASGAMLPRGERVLTGVAGLLLLGGTARSVDAGFVTAENGGPRALWAEPLGPVGAGTSRSGWTWGQPVTWRLTEEGLSFAAPPQGYTMRRTDLTQMDRGELGLEVDCEALLELALRGDRRARVQHRLRCDTTLSHRDAVDPYSDAVSVLGGLEPDNVVALWQEQPASPLDEPGALLVIAQLRTMDGRTAADRFALGSSYEQALLLHHMEQQDRESLAKALNKLSGLPEGLGEPYGRALVRLESLPRD